MNDKHIINEYFNTYYPKKKVFIHNEVFELIAGLFLGFFFSALKDTISNRAVQIVQRLDDPRIANNFIQDNEKITAQIEEYAKGNKGLEEKLKSIEKTLEKLNAEIEIEKGKTSLSSDASAPITTTEAKSDPMVVAIQNLTAGMTDIITLLQSSGAANEKAIKDLIKEIGKNFNKIGIPQEAIASKMESATKDAKNNGTITPDQQRNLNSEIKNTVQAEEPNEINKGITEEPFRVGTLDNSTIKVLNTTSLTEKQKSSAVLLLYIGNQLIYLKINKTDLPQTLTTLRVVASQKDNKFNIKSYNDITLVIENFIQNEFLEKIKSIKNLFIKLYQQTGYNNALVESRKQIKPQVEKVQVGAFTGANEQKDGWKPSYTIRIPSSSTVEKDEARLKQMDSEIEQQKNKLGKK